VTADEHIAESLRLRTCAQDADTHEKQAVLVALAQVHATLAVAQAAIAANRLRPGPTTGGPR
jgi:hypothetical protein